jgi:aminopeptidase N
MQGAKERYFRSEVVDRPVIDTAVTDLFQLLNANNYPKAAWILHMLRNEIGDWAFFGGVRDYYSTFRDSTALSVDLMRVMERHAGRPLRWFFEQWLLQPGYPEVESTWAYDSAGQAVEVKLTQVQQPAWGTYRIDVPVEVMVEGGGPAVRGMVRFNARSRTASVRLEQLGGLPTAVVVDPDGDLLLGVRQGSE